MENPFTLNIFDKDFNYVGRIGNPISVVATPRWNDTGTATVVVDLTHPYADQLLADGARMVIEMGGQFVLSGKISSVMAEGPSLAAGLTVQVKSDFRLLHQVVGWPVPTAALTAQSLDYGVYTGKAETIAKNVIRANMVSRLGMNVTVATDQGRGAVIPDGVSFRFHTLFERLLPAVEKAGLGITFRQSGTGIVCDVEESPVYPFVLTEESGVLQWWSWTITDPTATRVIAGGTGEGSSRLLREVINASLEAAEGDIVEVFRDARDSSSLTVLASRAQETLTEGAPKNGFAVRLSETDTFQYGRNGFVVGATVTVNVGGVNRTDILREVTMTFSRKDGVQVTPIVGEVLDNPDRTVAQFLSRLKKSVSDLKVSK